VPQTDRPNAPIYIDVFSMDFYSESVGTRVWFAMIVLPTLTSLTEFIAVVTDDVQPCSNVQ
jgi:hypothetical protein